MNLQTPPVSRPKLLHPIRDRFSSILPFAVPRQQIISAHSSSAFSSYGDLPNPPGILLRFAPLWPLAVWCVPRNNFTLKIKSHNSCPFLFSSSDLHQITFFLHLHHIFGRHSFRTKSSFFNIPHSTSFVCASCTYHLTTLTSTV